MALFNVNPSFAASQKSDITVCMIETKKRKVSFCSMDSTQFHGPRTQFSQLLKLLHSFGVSFDELYFAVPDIHGRSDIAAKVVSLLEAIGTRNAVFLGDYVDRMQDPLGVVRTIYQAKLRYPQWQMLLGNHELMALEALDSGIPLDEENSIFTLCSRSEIAECCKIFNALPVYHGTEHLIFTHGGIDSSYMKPIQDIPHSELLWSYGVNDRYEGRVIVRGHEIFDMPTEFKNNIATQTLSWCDNSPFCISIISNSFRGRKLLGWIEIELTGAKQVNFIILDSIGEQREKIGA